jgi:response regulator RpfG family c-di-GMP phosphodiesterase
MRPMRMRASQVLTMRRFRILLIEDNPLDVDLLRRAFTAADLECDVTVLNLPKNDGVEVLRAARATAALAQVPVAVLSSSAFSRERARIEPLGVGRYITKPADLDEFLRIGLTVKELLQRSE